jgi:hypothetical protein
MANTKIILDKQSNKILTGAQLLEPIGLVQGDIEGLVAQLEAIDKAAMNEVTLRTSADVALEAKIDADVSTEKAAREAADSTEKAEREAAVATEKARIDAILDASEADKDSFGEIVTLINQVDTANDEAFAGYVLSNNAALSSELVARAEGDSSLGAKIDADVSTEEAARLSASISLGAKIDADVSAEKAAGDAADVALESKIDAGIKSEMSARAAADQSIMDQVAANDKEFLAYRDATDAAILAEEEARIMADSSLDTRVNEAVFNTTPGVDSMYEMIDATNDAMLTNVRNFIPTRRSVGAGNYDSANGIVMMDGDYEEGSFMFFINGLMVEPGEDYTVNSEEDKSFSTITLLGDARTLADNGAKMVEYGVQFAEGNIEQVTSGISDPNAEEANVEGPIGDKV